MYQHCNLDSSETRCTVPYRESDSPFLRSRGKSWCTTSVSRFRRRFTRRWSNWDCPEVSMCSRARDIVALQRVEMPPAVKSREWVASTLRKNIASFPLRRDPDYGKGVTISQSQNLLPALCDYLLFGFINRGIVSEISRDLRHGVMMN